jgi:hypothetical protein
LSLDAKAGARKAYVTDLMDLAGQSEIASQPVAASRRLGKPMPIFLTFAVLLCSMAGGYRNHERCVRTAFDHESTVEACEDQRKYMEEFARPGVRVICRENLRFGEPRSGGPDGP